MARLYLPLFHGAVAVTLGLLRHLSGQNGYRCWPKDKSADSTRVSCSDMQGGRDIQWQCREGHAVFP